MAKIFKIKKAGGTWVDVTTFKIKTTGGWKTVAWGKHKLGTAMKTYWLNLFTRPAEGTYSSFGAMLIKSDGSILIGPKYHDPITTVLGYWRNTSVAVPSGTTVEVKVEQYLDQGDAEPGYSAYGTWLPLYPGSYTYKWASNNGGAGKQVLKVSFRDNAGNTIEWYCEQVYGGTGKVSYSPIVWSSGGGGTGGGGGTDPSDPFLETGTEPV